jgi:predicted Ser/Thr protein kinase
MKNREAKDIHFHAFYRHLFKTGDLITYNAVGILSSITKLVTNAPFSQVGLILNLPNKYTKKEELYVLEVTRNIDKFVDVFTEEKDSGVCIFRLIERLHQFPGHAIWWSPLNRPSEEKKVNEMLSWLWDVYKNGKNPNKKGRITKELRAKGPALRLLMEKFDLGKTESELCELASCDLVTKCLIRLGQVSEDSVHGVPTPLDIVNFPCYSKPVLIRVKMKYFNEQMLPPGVNLTQLTKDISTRPMELELSETLTTQNSRIETRNQTLPVSTTNGKKYLIPFTEIVIQKEIGEGSYGKVYVGHWKGNLVALKFCKKRGELEDFMKEVNLMIDLPSHPNIVLMLGVSLDGPQPVIVMEYCNGGGLDKLLVESNVKLSDEYKIRLVRGIAAGMLHLHKHNIIHRDLAARNILLTASGDPKISDFGMSRILKPTEIGKTKSNVGPVCWMAPESLAKGSYSKQSDVWMFGIVVYEIVAQTEPHKDKDMIDIAIQIQSKGLTPEIPSDCPEKLRQLMEMCWKKEPEQRPVSFLSPLFPIS